MLCSIDEMLITADIIACLVMAGTPHVGTSQEQEYDPALAAMADWPPPMHSLCNGSAACQLSRAGPTRLAVAVPLHALEAGRLSCLHAILPSWLCLSPLQLLESGGAAQLVSPDALLGQGVLAWLAAEPATTWVSPAPSVRLHNFWATSIMQTGTALQVDLTSSAPFGGSASVHTLWQAGLQARPWVHGTPHAPRWGECLGLDATMGVHVCGWLAQGQGMVLGMGDTGVDFDSCYFADPANPIPYTTQSGLQTEQASGKAYYANASNRKAGTLVLMVVICHACMKPA